jgi:hypothetical protein
VITCDIRDEIIDLQGSLMVGVARNSTLKRRAKMLKDSTEKV